jgi:hypothetical protein
MATLLQIEADAQALLDLIEGTDAELTSETESALDVWFKEVESAEASKLEGYCKIIRTFELRAAARKEEAERLAKLVRAEENKAKRLKERLKFHLEATGKHRIDTATYRITLVANGGPVPFEMPPDARELPPEYVNEIVTHKPRIEDIRDALAAGKAVPGCRLRERGCHVRIA